MAELTAKIFRDFFGGSWSGKIKKNGEFQREIVFNWPELKGEFSSLGTVEGMIVPPGLGVLDDTRQIAIGGWRSDIRRWGLVWHNEFGGYGEIQWTSQERIDGITVIYGFGHECKQESDDPTDHILMCKIVDENNFRFTMQSFRKGMVVIEGTRIRSALELNALLEKQVARIKNFNELYTL